MKRLLRYVCALLIIALSSCANESSTAPVAVAEKKVTRVRTVQIKPEMFTSKLTLTAEAKADKDAIISSEVLGRVVKVGFDKGMKVKEGDTIIWLDDSTLKADITQAKADLSLLELDFKKMELLSERNANVSKYQLEKARLTRDVAESRYQALEVKRKKYRIKAPVTGVVASRNVENGAITSPGAELGRVVSNNPIKIVIGVPESVLSDFALGKEATIVFDAYPDNTYQGTVSYKSAEINRKSRVFLCEIELPNDDDKILPEMSAKVTFIRKAIPGSILIPQTAVLEQATGHSVFIVDGKDIARYRKIEIDDSSDEMVLVGSGLATGEKLVITGQRNLIDGDTVEVAE